VSERSVLLIGGVRYCKHCVANAGGFEKARKKYTIMNARSGVMHLCPRKWELSPTLCGQNTSTSSWFEPQRVIDRREERYWRNWSRRRERQIRAGRQEQ